jgi:hypothetical protein
VRGHAVLPELRSPSTPTRRRSSIFLEIASTITLRRSWNGRGPYAEGGFWCSASFASFVAEKAEVRGFESSDSPAELHTNAVNDGRITDAPLPGYLVFIDLMGQGSANDYISHVGIVESVEVDTIVSIEGNADDSGVVTRQQRRVGDGYVIDFVPFVKEKA